MVRAGAQSPVVAIFLSPAGLAPFTAPGRVAEWRDPPSARRFAGKPVDSTKA